MMEDIFAENLVDEPDDIERVIEDGEELRRESDGGSDDDEKKKEEEIKEKEKSKIRKKMGPRTVLNAERLKGPRGIATIDEFFSGIKLDGRRGKEEKDLDAILTRLELWTHRLYPRGHFDDCLKKIENLGTNKSVRNYMTRILLGMEDGQSDVIRDEPNSPPPPDSTTDPFDELLSSTMGPPVTNGSNTVMTTDQRDMMLMNRLVAEDRRAARIRRAQELKERFKARHASNLLVNGEVSTIEPQRFIPTETRLQNSEDTLQMEVDNNHDSIRENEDGGLDETEKGLNTFEIQERGNKEKLDKTSDQESSLQEVIDGAEQIICSSQENCGENISKGDISQKDGIEQIENKTIEEMEICEMTSTTGNLTTENHIILKEEIKSKNKDISIENHGELKLKEGLLSGDQADCFEKENENPNNSH